MPTILRIGGLRFVVYPNDHPPAHVHVIGPGWTVVVDLHGPELREVVGPCFFPGATPGACWTWWLRIVRPYWRDGGGSMVELTDEQFEAAKRRGDARLQGPHAVTARYDAGRGRLVIALSTGVELGLAPRDVEGLAGASVDDLRAVEIDSQGLGIHFPRLDADVYVPALLEGVLGSRGWMAARLGAAGGQARSPAKTTAARENGRRGGRPRKSVGGA